MTMRTVSIRNHSTRDCLTFHILGNIVAGQTRERYVRLFIVACASFVAIIVVGY